MGDDETRRDSALRVDNCSAVGDKSDGRSDWGPSKVTTTDEETTVRTLW
jgi:hypothetical protein